MRYDVKKFLFVGVERDKALFFQRAQEAGIIHFINPKPSQTKEASIEVQKVAQAIKVLRGLPVVEQDETHEFGIADAMVNKILDLKHSLNALAEEERIIRLEISRVAAFGDFSLEEIAKIEKEANRKIQFYCAKRGYAEHHSLPLELIYIDSDHGLDYFIAINKESKQYPKMVEMFIDRPHGALKNRYHEIEKEIHAKEHLLKSFAKYNTFLHHVLVRELNDHDLETAKKCIEFPIDKENLFVVQGWVPVNKMNELYALVNEFNVFVEEVHPDPTDVIPTCLENYGVSRLGEDLVHIYDTPSNKDNDPSLWVLLFFALFFSMIIGDGGYGLVLLSIALYIRYKHSAIKGMKKRFLDLFTILGFSCVVWGVLTTSFFGITIAPDNPIRHVSAMSWLAEKKAAYHVGRKDEVYQEWLKKVPELKDVTNMEEFLVKASSINNRGTISYDAYGKFSDNIMMELALLVGVIHIVFSMARYGNRNWANLGWIVFIIGAYLYTPSFLGAASIVNFAFGVDPQIAATVGLDMMYVGFGTAVVAAIIQHKWLGLLEASVLIQIFGDILSYLRLYALGLSGSLLTATTIDLAAGLPLVFGVILLVFGHIVNIVLGIMGGVIHGLRLNFLEWYHYSFEGGGKMFHPLKKQEIE